jgi:hypothetical protein
MEMDDNRQVQIDQLRESNTKLVDVLGIIYVDDTSIEDILSREIRKNKLLVSLVVDTFNKKTTD